jgi:hypothetical protein
MRAGHIQPTNTHCNNSVIFRQSLAPRLRPGAFVAFDQRDATTSCIANFTKPRPASLRLSSHWVAQQQRHNHARVECLMGSTGTQPPVLTGHRAENLRPLDDLRSPKMIQTTWRDFYRAAILELDRSLLKVRVAAAEDSINARASDARASRQEKREMADALWTLQRLKRTDRRLVPIGVESARELH